MTFQVRLTREEAQIFALEYPNQVRSPQPTFALERGRLTNSELVRVIELLCGPSQKR